MKARFETVDDYVAAQEEGVRACLEVVRGAIRKAEPAAEEEIAYQMPGFKLRGKPLLYFAAWKKHYSLYPVSRSLVKAFSKELAAYEIHGSTLRLDYGKAVPVGLIERIVAFRAGEINSARS